MFNILPIADVLISERPNAVFVACDFFFAMFEKKVASVSKKVKRPQWDTSQL